MFPTPKPPSNDAQKKAAEQSRKDEAARQDQLSRGMGNINSTFSQYNDGYYNNLANQYRSFYAPQLDKQYRDAKEQALFNAARAGTINSSAASKTNADVASRFGEQRQAIESGANNYANQARQQIEAQRAGLVSQLYSTGDSSVAAAGMNQIGAPALPALSPLASVFDGISGLAANDARIRAYDPNAPGIVGSLTGKKRGDALNVVTG